VAELNGEKLDVIPWAEDPAQFVANALSPAQVVGVTIDETARIATVTVPERMLSLAIGREGQNARLAAKLTGWRIDIRSDQPRVDEHAAPSGPAAAAGTADVAATGRAATIDPAAGTPLGEPASAPHEDPETVPPEEPANAPHQDRANQPAGNPAAAPPEESPVARPVRTRRITRAAVRPAASVPDEHAEAAVAPAEEVAP